MTVQKLKELLNQYPDDATIVISDNECDYGKRKISSILIEYIDGDDYTVPEIILT